jgi:hypothetical protein
MRIAVLASAALLIVAGASSLSSVQDRQAIGPQDFIVSATNGYGVADCLTSASDCGHTVANAWCSSQGFSKATHFRKAEESDVTASINLVAASDGDGIIIVTCAN